MTEDDNLKPLKQINFWINWQTVTRGDKEIKLPCSPRGKTVSVTDPTCYLAFSEVQNAQDNRLGFVFCENHPFVGIDLDDCFSESGELSEFASSVLTLLNSYSEYSPSGKGLHILVRTSVNKTLHKAIKREECEVYFAGRYFTVTERAYQNISIREFNKWEELRNLINAHHSTGTLRPGLQSRLSLQEGDLQARAREIHWGEIDNRLFSRACKARDEGYAEEEILGLLHVWRARDVIDSDKVPDSHLEDIARSACRYEPTSPAANQGHSRQSSPDLETEASLVTSAPGWLGSLGKDILDAALIPNPAATLAALIAAAGTMYGRKIETGCGKRTNCYTLVVSPPGNGKDYPRKICKLLYLKMVAPVLFAIDDVTSDTAINSLLCEHPSITLILDELGIWLTRAYQSKGAEQTIVRTLLSIYNQAAEPYFAKRMASGDGMIIEHPNLSFFGSGTPEQITRAMSAGAAGDGLLSRIMFFQSPNRIEPREFVGKSVPLDAYAEMLKGVLKSGTVSMSSYPQPVVYDVETPVMRDFTKRLHKRLKLSPPRLQSLLVRIPEHVRKLALIGKASDETKDPSDWAVAVAEHQIDQAVFWFERALSVNSHEAESNFLLTIIENAGHNGLSHAEVVQQSRHVKRNDRSAMLQDLVDSGYVISVKQRLGGYRYYINKHSEGKK